MKKFVYFKNTNWVHDDAEVAKYLEEAT